MTQNPLNINIREKVKTFIGNLHGRYNPYISEIMLEHLLISEIKREYSTQHMKTNKEISAAAYSAGAYIFESLLEHKCHAIGNGHHVAQNLAKMFEDA